MLKVKGVNRGMVERFIAPVLKTGEPLRVPGVRIPPPLQAIKASAPIFSGHFLLVAGWDKTKFLLKPDPYKKQAKRACVDCLTLPIVDQRQLIPPPLQIK